MNKIKYLLHTTRTLEKPILLIHQGLLEIFESSVEPVRNNVARSKLLHP